MRLGRIAVFQFGAVFGIVCGTANLPAQSPNGSPAASIGAQAVKVVLKHFTINPLAADPNTHQPLRADGSWSIGKDRPSACPQSAETCVEVFYTVAEQSAKCSWAVSLDENGTDGTILDENDDTDNYMVRTVSDSEALPLIKSRAKPVYPPIALAARVTGPVVMTALVGKTGEVQRVGVVSGPPMLIQTSIDAVKKWTFVPMTAGTRALPYEVRLVFTFSLIPSDLREGIIRMAP